MSSQVSFAESLLDANDSPQHPDGYFERGGGIGKRVVIRYFSTTTPKDEGSLILWQNPPKNFSGLQLKAHCMSKGLPLEVREVF